MSWMRRTCRCVIRGGLCFSLTAIAATTLSAAEIYSNGGGGGEWSESSTWRGGAVPGAADSAVISREDRIVFARNDADAVTCLHLYMDPKSALIFKPRAGAVTLTLGGTMESYGSIVLDGTRGSDDVMQIRFVGEEIEQRHFKVMKGGSLVLSGRETAADMEPNVRITSHPPNEKEKDATTKLSAEDGAGVDLRRAKFENVAVYLNNIDNTGAEHNERVNIVGNRFVGQALVYLTSCDTPVITDNQFNRDMPGSLLQPAAIGFNSCALSEVRGNTIKGTYFYGLNSWACADDSIVDNTIVDVYIGVHWYGSNVMFRNLTIRNSSLGMQLNYMSGVIENLITENCVVPINVANAVAQISNWRPQTPNVALPRAVDFGRGRLVLLNCDVKPEQVNVPAGALPMDAKEHQDKPLVQSMEYLVVGVKGAMPPGASVDVVTSNPNPPLKPGQLDLNVRNSPATVQSNRLTPLPGTQQSLVVQSWSYDIHRKLVESPKYAMNLCGPADASGNRPVLKSVPVQPAGAWYRPLPDDPIATMEVTLP